ncbi:hybrid signal transduction histidine kinase M [Tanacetum coccineum]
MTNSEHPSPPPTLTLVEKLYVVHNINSLIPEKLDLAESNYSTWSYFFKGDQTADEYFSKIEVLLTLTTSSAPQVLLAEASSRNQTEWNNRERDNRTTTREVCRNFGRGFCHWGDACRFLHDSSRSSGSGYQQKDRKPSQNDKTEHGMEKTERIEKAKRSKNDQKPTRNERDKNKSEETAKDQSRINPTQSKKETMKSRTPIESQRAKNDKCAKFQGLIWKFEDSRTKFAKRGKLILKDDLERSSTPLDSKLA